MYGRINCIGTRQKVSQMARNLKHLGIERRSHCKRRETSKCPQNKLVLPSPHPHHTYREREREREAYHTLKAETRTVYSALVIGIYILSSTFTILF
jgi:hypothetical protein